MVLLEAALGKQNDRLSSTAPSILLVGKPKGNSANLELDKILAEAGLKIACAFADFPFEEDLESLIHPTKEKVNVFNGLKAKRELQESVENLHRQIDRLRPKLLLSAGSLALWALSDNARITTSGTLKLPTGASTWRGSQLFSREILGKRYPLLPLIHPTSILRDWSFRQITVQDLRRGVRFLATGAWAPQPKTFQLHRPTYQQVLQRLRAWKLLLAEGPLDLSVDLETYKRKWVSVIGLADATCELCIPLIFKGEERIKSYFALREEQEIWTQLKTILEHPNVRIIGQNFIYDTEWFHRLYNIEALVSFDTMVAHHLLFPGTPKRLDYLASLYCEHYSYWKDESGDWDLFPDDADRYWKYNCKDTRATYECAKVLKAALSSQAMDDLYSFQMENWKLSRSLMLRGIAFDSSHQAALRLQLMEEAASLSSWLLEAVPEAFRFSSSGKPWHDSPKQTALLLYEVIGLKPVLQKSTKRPTTDDSALQELGERAGWLSPLIERLRHLRSLGVFTSNFLEARASVDGRMRCTFNIAHPETFRWSSNSNGFGEGTNLQNIPKGE